MGRPEENPVATGQRFGHLVVTVLNFDFHYDPRGYGRKRHLCQCDCGESVTVMATALKNGNTISCGCQGSRKTAGQRNRTHGHSTGGRTTPEYRAWYHMVQRCYNNNDCAFRNYGGRGIKVCEQWRDSFEAFLKDVGQRPSSKHSLDRYPNNNGNYEPGNIRWATYKEQARNKRNNRLLTYQGETRCVREWEEVLGIKTGLIGARLHIGQTGNRLFVREQRVGTA